MAYCSKIFVAQSKFLKMLKLQKHTAKQAIKGRHAVLAAMFAGFWYGS